MKDIKKFNVLKMKMETRCNNKDEENKFFL